MNDNYTMEQLDAMGIFELRTIARSVGVKSPTTAKKAELVQAILDIESGKVKPVNNSQRRGRPPKDISLTEGELLKANAVNKGVECTEKREEETTMCDDMSDRDNIETRDTRDNSEEKVDKDEVEDKEEKSEVRYAERQGWLEILPDGYGFLRAENCENSKNDTYLSQKLIRSLGLRQGDDVVAETRILKDNKQPAATKVVRVNGRDPYSMRRRPNFDSLTPIYPNERLKLEKDGKKNEYAIRCIDLIAPIGKGQRAMIVSPPKAGKTTLLKMIANAITESYPEVEMYVLLVDERPEEVTDMKRSIKGTVIYSTFDETPEHHAKSAELLIERAKRSVEMGKDVVIIMDSLTRLARAYNLTIPPTGRTLSGGIDPGALHSPKRFFGAARNIENGGSLTIIATALIDTGSKMDDVIYEEFKGTGNMEIHLDRKLSEKRIFPAIDINKSGTRKEDLLLGTNELAAVYSLRRMLAEGDNAEATEMFIKLLTRTGSNKDLVSEIILGQRQAQMMSTKGGYKKV